MSSLAMSAQSPTPSPTPQRFNVYIVRDGPIMADPDLPGVRYHNTILVETGADGSGVIHHVTGDLVLGFHYERKESPPPELSPTFYSKEFFGTVLASAHPVAFDQVCEAQPPPPRQKAFNMATMKTEPFKADGSFYQPGEQSRPLVKCTEWTERQAMPALFRSNVVQRTHAVTLEPSSAASSDLSSR
ncbi:uncharacterized protein LTR77_004216 [Saxophila tyrrhenica]|uniref:Uncharacterized protein n=1 Tax=Saxophila tyrrhenica TaxID=1690608 RepID=A0AAV9PFH6_9PEZI|nr:hypothetical protein LTR77_004216 [Saxophila tyrrhenica]